MQLSDRLTLRHNELPQRQKNDICRSSHVEIAWYTIKNTRGPAAITVGSSVNSVTSAWVWDVGVIFNQLQLLLENSPYLSAPPRNRVSFCYTEAKLFIFLAQTFKIPAARISLGRFQRVGTDQFSKHICVVCWRRIKALLNELYKYHEKQAVRHIHFQLNQRLQ